MPARRSVRSAGQEKRARCRRKGVRDAGQEKRAQRRRRGVRAGREELHAERKGNTPGKQNGHYAYK